MYFPYSIVTIFFRNKMFMLDEMTHLLFPFFHFVQYHFPLIEMPEEFIGEER